MSNYISPADLDAAKEFVRAYRIDLHDPSIMRDLEVIDSDRSRDVRLFASVQQRLDRYRAYTEENPYTVAPHGAVGAGRILLARQVANRLAITISEIQLLCHMLILGASGTGKTTLLRRILNQVLSFARVVLLDKKDDTLRLACSDERLLLISPTARLNLLQKPSFLSLEEWITVFCDAFGRTLYSGERQKNLLSEVLTEVFADHDIPCLADVTRRLRTRPQKTFQDRNDHAGTASRLERIGRCYPALYTTRNGVPWSTLFDHSVHISSLLGEDLFLHISTLYTSLLYLHNRRNNIRDELTHVIVADEGQALWSATQNNIERMPPLAHLHGQIREYGLASILTALNLSTLHPLIKSNVFTTISFAVAGGQETRAVANYFGLDSPRRQHFETRLPKGGCIIGFSDGWKYPLLAQCDPLPIEKAVTASERAAAETRINQHAPAELPPTIQSDPEPTPPAASTPTGTQQSPTKHRHETSETEERASTSSTGEAPEPSEEPAHHAEPASTDATAHLFPEDEPRRVPVKLTANEERLLRITLERLLTATEAYRLAGLARQAGQTAKDKLVTLGLLEEHRILVRAGRGGNAVLLAPTAAAYELLGRTRPSTTRGGDSAQHRWLIQELAARLPGCVVEFVLGGKSVDLFLRYDAKQHKSVLFHIETNELLPEALLAIEVECDPSKTAASNIEKNAAVGITHTIIAVLPKHLEKTKKALATNLPAELQDAYSVVDVFALLEGCEQ